MESYEQAVDLALMVVNLDKSVYKTMIRTGLKQYLNSQYPYVLRTNNKNEIDKFRLASQILLNDLQSIPVSSCPGRECSSCMVNKCDSSVNFQTPVFEEALIDPFNVVNSNVTRYIDGFNPNTFDPQISRMTQPLDTIGLYQNKLYEPIMNYGHSTGYGPQTKVRLQDNFSNLQTQPNTHPIQDTRNTYYNQYSSVYVNDNGEGYFHNEIINKIDNENPTVTKMYKKIHNNKFEQ
jgi:hypothetical protein